MTIVGLLAAGCGAQGPNAQGPNAQAPGTQAPSAPAHPAVADARRVDMCTILTGAELTALGARLDTRRHFNKVGVVGCRWLGEPFTLSMERDTDTLAG
ncbi:MAG: DUF3558 family protein [Pseudonocardiales bacterium]|nr:DUF3558 family protein [Pseudonocardiales bacterium]MBV9029836.1 DUF3558 family protein [Pseudonocardiales bacterium]